jgi:predicted RNase H-like nuclease (RuvC/YqgF family)
MREGKPVIVGIDPGTTTGIAVFDLDGELLLIKSGKNLSKSDVSRIISDIGNPVIITSDINPIPKAVERVATSFSARLLEPGETFSRKEKHLEAKRYMRYHGKVWSNRHERDALVSAIYAWKRLRRMIEKIDSKLKKARIMEKSRANRIRAEVLLKQRSIDLVIKRHS